MSYNLNSLKGRIAEQIIQDLFICNKYNVFNYGIERIMPGITKRLNVKKDSPTGKALRFMPDFVVQSILNGDLLYVEVKFRANGHFNVEEIDKNYPYKNAWFIIVSPHKIQGVTYKGLKAGFEITNDTNYSLLKIKSFHINPEILNEYEEYCRVIFEGFNKKAALRKLPQ